MKGTPEQRLWAKTDRSGGEDACWYWLGATTRGGYGRIGKGARAEGWCFAHRLSYELACGPVPEGLVLDHLCRTRNCVNPRHLEPVTIRENIHRGIKGVLTTHCPQGHEYTIANTYWSPPTSRRGPARRCRECARKMQVAIRESGYWKRPEYMAFKRELRRMRSGRLEV